MIILFLGFSLLLASFFCSSVEPKTPVDLPYVFPDQKIEFYVKLAHAPGITFRNDTLNKALDEACAYFVANIADTGGGGKTHVNTCIKGNEWKKVTTVCYWNVYTKAESCSTKSPLLIRFPYTYSSSENPSCPTKEQPLFSIPGYNKAGVIDKCFLSCQLPFVADGTQCTTYCPEGSSFDTGLGRCEIKKDETPQCDAQQHNPIDTSTGEKRQVFTDFQQNSSFPLSFSRSYASLRAPEPKAVLTQQIKAANKVKIVQPSGYKTPNIGSYQLAVPQKQGHIQWRHNYQITLVKYDAEDVAITLSNMTLRTFSYNETSSVYLADFPNGDSLQKNAEGWLYIDNNQTNYQFNLVGQLVTLSNAFNETLTLSYDVNDKLSSITNDQNESLTYTYGPSGLLTEVTQPDGNIIYLTYDGYTNLSAVIYPDDTEDDLTDNPRETYHYENATHPYALTGITDEKGVRFATWTYNDIGQATKVSHALKADTGTIHYDTENSRIISTNSLGNTTSITFDIAGRVSTVNGASCSTSGEKGTSSYTYNNQGQVQTHTDESNAVTYKTYETSGLAQGKVNKIIALYGTEQAQTTEMTYDTDNVKPTQITHPNGLVESFIYGVNNRLESHALTTDIETRTTTYHYNTEGQLTSIDGSRLDVSDITTFTYSNGRLSSLRNALGHTTTFENYDAFGNATQITDPNGVVSQLIYDVRGRLTHINKAGRMSQFEYDEIGQLIKVTKPSGSYLHYTYDDARRLTDITNNLGESIHFNLDSEGNITQKEVIGTDENILFSQQFVYEQTNLLSQTISATNQVWKTEYDVAGNIVKQVSPNRTDIESTFDQLKRVSQQLAQDDSTTSYEYNKLNQLTKVTDALGRETTYQYNKFGELINQTSQDTGITTSTYDLAGNLATQTDARGVVATYQYDALNRVTSVSYSELDNNTAKNTLYIYDNADFNNNGIGKLTRVENVFDTTDLFYNSNGELIKEITAVNNKTPISNDVHTYTTEYKYNLDGQITRITYPSGRMVAYYYNAVGLITKVTTVLNGDMKILADNINYLPFGGMKSLTYGNGRLLTQTYNQNYQLIDKTVDNVLSKTYVYEPINNIEKITDNFTHNYSETFAYNNVNRLTQAVGHYGDLAYGYDAIGNRLSSTKNDGNIIDSTQYAYKNSSQLSSLTGAVNTLMTYNARGDLISKGNKHFTYNNEARLSSATVNNTTTYYHYNYRGERIAKLFANGEFRYYVYNMHGLLMAELNNEAETQIEYIYLNGQRIAIVAASTSTSTNSPTEDEQTTITNAYYVHTSHLDTPLALTNYNGDIVWQASYTPFGEINITLDTLPEHFTARFPGQYSDNDTGFYYNYFRDYDPELGRYIQSDPIGLGGGINTYGYVGGNPVSYIDPLGLAECTYSISAQNVTCVSDNGQIYSEVSTGVFSGNGEGLNSLEHLNSPHEGPVLPGSYDMISTDKYGGSFLLKDNALNRVLYKTGFRRGGFFYHKGTISEGCITVNSRDKKAMEQWKSQFDMLLNEKKNTMTVTP